MLQQGLDEVVVEFMLLCELQLASIVKACMVIMIGASQVLCDLLR